MYARALLAGLVAISILMLAAPASAKPGIAHASIGGPGLDDEIRIEGADTDGLSDGGIDLGGGHSRADSVEELGLTAADLGPRYVVTYRFKSSDARIRQDLYPYADGGPVTYTPSDQELWGESSLSIAPGWYQASRDFFHYLVDHGFPERNPVVAVTAAEPDGDSTGGAKAAPWAAFAVTLIGLAAGGADVMRRRRRRGSINTFYVRKRSRTRPPNAHLTP
jgi:hypothetical protein